MSGDAIIALFQGLVSMDKLQRFDHLARFSAQKIYGIESNSKKHARQLTIDNDTLESSYVFEFDKAMLKECLKCHLHTITEPPRLAPSSIHRLSQNTRQAILRNSSDRVQCAGLTALQICSWGSQPAKHPIWEQSPQFLHWYLRHASPKWELNGLSGRDCP
jgi:hypothetical protein